MAPIPESVGKEESTRQTFESENVSFSRGDQKGSRIAAPDLLRFKKGEARQRRTPHRQQGLAVLTPAFASEDFSGGRDWLSSGDTRREYNGPSRAVLCLQLIREGHDGWRMQCLFLSMPFTCAPHKALCGWLPSLCETGLCWGVLCVMMAGWHSCWE